MRYQTTHFWAIAGLGDHFTAATAGVFRAVAEAWVVDMVARLLRQGAAGPAALTDFVQRCAISVRLCASAACADHQTGQVQLHLVCALDGM